MGTKRTISSRKLGPKGNVQEDPPKRLFDDIVEVDSENEDETLPKTDSEGESKTVIKSNDVKRKLEDAESDNAENETESDLAQDEESDASEDEEESDVAEDEEESDVAEDEEESDVAEDEEESSDIAEDEEESSDIAEDEASEGVNNSEDENQTENTLKGKKETKKLMNDKGKEYAEKLDGLKGQLKKIKKGKSIKNLPDEHSIDDKIIGRTELDDKLDEYADGDSSDEEDVRNTIGSVPLEWYDDYDHIGYDVGGQKIYKPERGDALDEFLRRSNDPNYANTIYDPMTGQDVQLTEGDLDLVHRLMKGKVPAAGYNMNQPFLDLFSHEVEEMPLTGRPEDKRSFIPSKSDRAKVSKMVAAIKEGRTHKYLREKRYGHYDSWGANNGDDEIALLPDGRKRSLHPNHKAPAEKTPTNTRSYLPAPEFLPTKKHLDHIETLPPKTKRNMLARLPRVHSSVRTIPNDASFVMDTFNRSSDLYAASRFAYRKVIAKSKDLLPKLPKSKDLRPYPTQEKILFKGHRSIVRAINVHPSGNLLATGSDDHTVKIWDTSFGRCLRTLEVGDAVMSLAWSPNTQLHLLAVAVGECLLLINPESYLTEKSVVERTNKVLAAPPEQGDYSAPERVQEVVQWRKPSEDEWKQGYRVVIKHKHQVTQVVWHPKGDYFATLQPYAHRNSVVTHQLARHRSQLPFTRAGINVTAISFHPTRQNFYICTRTKVRIYSLVKKSPTQTVSLPSCEPISCISIHPSGDHFVTGSLGNKIGWIEVEYTKRPLYLRYHHGAVRSIATHRKYPLMASASDDGRVIITHTMVYKDWMKDPLFVPVKELRNHSYFDHMCVLAVDWHPSKPFLFTAGADSTIRMWE